MASNSGHPLREMNQIRWSTVAQHAIPGQPHQLSGIGAEGLQPVVIPRGQLREGRLIAIKARGSSCPPGNQGS